MSRSRSRSRESLRSTSDIEYTFNVRLNDIEREEGRTGRAGRGGGRGAGGRGAGGRGAGGRGTGGRGAEGAQAELPPEIVDRLIAFTQTDEWVDPEKGSPILVIERKYAEMIVSGKKKVEIRRNQMKKLKPGDTLWIAAKQDPHQGRRAWRSPFAFAPKKSQILGSVVFSHSEELSRERFNAMADQHCLEEDFADYVDFDERKVCGWFFTSPKQCIPREYHVMRGSQSWRKFYWWI